MTSLTEKPLAIIGMACRLPGADDLDEYWQILAEGRSPLGELPGEVFDRELYYHPKKGLRSKSYTTLGGLTSDAPFDPHRCPIPRELIERSHKVHLKLLQTAGAACRHAGYDPFGVPVRRTGVYIGHTPPCGLFGPVTSAKLIEHTARYLREIEGFDALSGGQTEAIIDEVVHEFRRDFPPGDPKIEVYSNAYHAAALISRSFGFEGPSMSMDAACASSLRALGHAMRALQSDQIEMALVGGASVCNTDTLVLFSAAQSVSATGSRPFDDDADGLVASEGYVVLLVKTLERAIAEGDRVLAVIRSIGVSSDGKGKSLWAPRREGQIAAVERAYGGNVRPERLQYIEAHATSTQLGDATELNALSEVLPDRLNGGRIPIGSAKANIGHTLETAGVASLVKTVLAMNHGLVPPQINVNRLNKRTDWERAPFFVPRRLVDWPAPKDGGPRSAAVNAFGIGGLNVHVVLEEPVQGSGVRSQGSGARSQGSGVRSRGSEDRGSKIEDRRRHHSPLTTHHSPLTQPIAIVGMGAVLPGARTVEALWDLFASGRDQKREAPPDRWDVDIGCDARPGRPWRVPTSLGGFITDFEYDWKRHKVPPRQVAHADPLQFMLLDAADQAFRDAGCSPPGFDRARTGVIVGTIFGGDFSNQLQMGIQLPRFRRLLAELLRRRGAPKDGIQQACEAFEELLLKRMPALLDETGSFTASTLASRITKTFDLMGGATAIDAGDASAMAALSCCVDLLRAGDCDMMVCAAGQRSLDFCRYDAMFRSGELAFSVPSPPFDSAASGCIPGEGVGVVILKRLADARRDGNRIHGIIHGVAAACRSQGSGVRGRGSRIEDRGSRHGSHQERSSIIPHPSSGLTQPAHHSPLTTDHSPAGLRDSVRTAAVRSLASAGINAAEVGAVEVTATGRPDVDRAQIEGLAAAYGGHDRTASILVGAAAGQLGHAGGGAGMVALLKAVCQTQHVQVTGHVGLAQPADYVRQCGETLAVPVSNSPIEVTTEDGRLFAGIDCFSQYNLAYHVVLERGTKLPRQSHPAQRTERRRGSGVRSRGSEDRGSRNKDRGSRIAATTHHSPLTTHQPGRQSPIVNPTTTPSSLPDAGSGHRPTTGHRPQGGRDASAAGRGGWRIVRLGARDAGALRGQIEAAAADAAQAFERAGNLLASLERPSFDPGETFRLAVVASAPDDLAGKLHLALAQFDRPESLPLLAERGVFFGRAASNPRSQSVPHAGRASVVFLFPGQGSQYQGMLRSLIEEFPPAARARDQVNAVLASMQLPSFEELAWQETEVRDPEAGGRGQGAEDRGSGIENRGPRRPLTTYHSPLTSSIWRTQLSLLAADMIVFAAARAVGLRPDRVSGHSFGELAALAAAGAWTFDDALRATAARCRAIDACTGEKGAMLSTSAPVNELKELCRRCEGNVFISHHNAPDQTVAGGERQAVARLEQAVRERGYKCVMLDVPAAFHTPLMEGVKGPFSAALAEIALEPPRIPLLSSVTNRYTSEPDEIRENLVVQMTRPVQYVELIERLAREGVGALVEVGPKHVLTGLARRILAPGQLATVGCDHPKRPGLQQLLFARACLEAGGALDHRREESPIRVSSTSSGTREARPQHVAGGRGSRIEDRGSRPSILVEQHGLTVLRLSGSPFEMGLQHGQAHRREIRRVLRRYADLAGTQWDAVYDLPHPPERAEEYFGPDELEELRGIARGADVSVDAVIAHNLRLFLDAGAGGLHFALASSVNPQEGLIHAANLELRRALGVQDCLARHIQVRRPAGRIAHVAFGVAGEVGTLGGINSAGLAVSTSSLLDVTLGGDKETRAERGGLLHTVLVKKILEDASDINEAIGLVRRFKSCVPWSLCLSEARRDRLCYIEFDGRDIRTLPAVPSVVAANHRLMQTVQGHVPEHALRRFERLKELLGGDRPERVDVARAQAALRDRVDLARGRETPSPTLNTLQRVDNQISIVMQPGCGQLWVTGGPDSNGDRAEFRQFDLAQLLGEAGSQEPGVRSQGSGIEGQALNSQLSTLNPDTTHHSPLTAHQDVCSRFVLRMLEVPPAVEPARLPLEGPALVLGRNAAADALVAALTSRGAAVHQLSTGDDAEAALAELHRHTQAGPAPHLFVMTAWDPDAVTELDADAWSRRRRRGVITPYRVCQEWYRRLLETELLPRATLLAATALGGDFGVSGSVRGVESGALMGLLKGVDLELKLQRRIAGFRARLVDFPASAGPSAIAEAVLLEFATDDGELEVGYLDGRRHVPRPLHAAPEKSKSRRVEESKNQQAPAPLPANSAVIVTGGARGVTAEVALALGKTFGVRLHLVGSSRRPDLSPTYHDLSDEEMKEVRAAVMKEALAGGEKPAEAWSRFEKALEIDHNLRAFERAGVEAVYHQCDVADREALARLLEEIRAGGAPITAIVHGAGFERAAGFEKKKPQLVDRTVAAKVDGAAALMELTAEDPLRCFIAFGSVAGRFGGVGQTDYTAANEMLAKLIDWHRARRPGCAATVFHWHAWDDVGMAVRPESKHISRLHNIRFMPVEEGCRHLIDELRAGLPESEVVVTEASYVERRYGNVEGQLSVAEDEKPQTKDDGQRTKNKEQRTKDNGPPPLTTHLPSPRHSEFPLIDAVAEHQPGRRLTAEVHLDPTRDVFLLQHRFKGEPMLPAVAMAEAAAEAALLLAPPGRQIAALRDVELLSGLRFHSDEGQVALVHAELRGEEIVCDFTCDFYNRRGQLLLKDKPYLRAAVELADGPPRLSTRVDASRRPRSMMNCWYFEEGLVIYHGPVFRSLRQIHVPGPGDEGDGWAHLVASPPDELAGEREGDRWVIPAALLDAVFFGCGSYLWIRFDGTVAIPERLERLAVGRLPRPEEQCLLHMAFRGREGRHGLFDCTVLGEKHDVILQVDGYRNVIVAEEPAHVA